MKIKILFQKSFTLVLASSVLLSACTTLTHPLITTQPLITDPSKRLEFEKFSILPPQGDNWYVLSLKPDDNFAILAKVIDLATFIGVKSSQTPTIRARIKGVDMEPKSVGSKQEFLDTFKHSKPPPARYTVLKESYLLREKVGEYCVISDILSEDRGNPADPGTVYLLQLTALVCFDPENHLEVNVSCSQRVPDIKDMIDLKDECEPFMNSLRFSHQ